MLREERKATYVSAIAALSRLQDALRIVEALPATTATSDIDAIVCPEYEATRTTLLSVYLLGGEEVRDYAGGALGSAALLCSTAPHDDVEEGDNEWEHDFGYNFLGMVAAARKELAEQ